MKNHLYKFFVRVIPFFTLMGLLSCDKFLDVKPENALEPNQYYRDIFDANSAVLGVYGQFMSLADHYVLLNELRADLMDVTGNSDKNLKELNSHTVSPENIYADPKPFYKVILNCNDVLKNFDIMLRDKKISEKYYNERYSDIAMLRSWLYLQLVIHYGNVPYITEPFVNINDVKDLSRFPVLSIEEMVKELVSFVEALPYKEIYPSDDENSLNTSMDGYNTRTFFINKLFFLGDLHLWNGDYLMAAQYYKRLMEIPVPTVVNYDSYKMKGADVSTNIDLAIGYIRYREGDVSALIDDNAKGWKSMFIRPQDNLYNMEWIWAMPFDKRFSPKNPFLDLFSNEAGRYLVKPSQSAIDRWNSEIQSNGFTFDQRGKFTYNIKNGQPVIMKYIYNYNPLKPLEMNGQWFLARAALLHLRYAEAANRDGQNRIAFALLNNGIRGYYDNPDYTLERDIDKDFATFLSFPYDFDARSSQNPLRRDLWHRNAGVRGRAFLRNYVYSKDDSAKYYNMSTPGRNKQLTNLPALIVDVENKIINEAALELAYEGNRWSDLVRIAIRRNEPSFLADKIYDKLKKAGNPEAERTRAKLMNRENWFLPFKWDINKSN